MRTYWEGDQLMVEFGYWNVIAAFSYRLWQMVKFAFRGKPCLGNKFFVEELLRKKSVFRWIFNLK